MNKLAGIVGISQKEVEWQIAKLKKEGRIKRIGSDKGGHWEVMKCIAPMYT
jgi:ATP-dependent DNA helicase RecG